MKSLQNNTLKTNWPKGAILTKNVYFCSKINEMSEELKPYTMEEIDAMLDESERDFEAGRVYTTEEVIKMCMKGY